MNSQSSSWTEVTLGEVCEFKYGKSLPEAKRMGGEIPVYGSNGIVGYHSDAITDGTTIVVGRKGSYGEVNLSLTSCWTIDTTYYIDRSATDSNLKWLAYRLANLGLNKLNKAAAVPGLNREDAYRIKLLLPPIAQQKRIAAILDKAEELRGLRRQALGELDALTQSIFLEMFGDPEKNPKAWAEHELQKVVKQGTIVTYGIVQAGEEFPGGVPYIRTGDIVDGEIKLPELRRTDPQIAAKFDRSKVDAGDIVMSIRATVGTTALVPSSLQGANLTQGTARIAPGDKIERLYLLNFLRATGTQHWIARQVKGATFREITLARLRELPVLLPPLSLQQVFARRVEAIEQLKATHRKSLAHLDALFASLQHRAFRGKL